ncbi:hypothetical protein BP5796_10251 [Coleophoma crateriformis]|uniref:Uncharacterized protein n=1 Tax=Coleophoma crateriformis TaxID=565419 RepID=A0A3D8QUW8_9HELO|nr:hypothetical protein BP5796_10251 [Coleophoma crateriformis]
MSESVVAPRRSARIAATGTMTPKTKSSKVTKLKTPKAPKSTKSAKSTKAKTPKSTTKSKKKSEKNSKATENDTKAPENVAPNYDHLLVPVKIPKGLKKKPAQGEEGFYCRIQLGKDLALMTADAYGDRLTQKAKKYYGIAELDHELDGLTRFAILAGALELAASSQGYAMAEDGVNYIPVVKGGISPCQIPGMSKTMKAIVAGAGLDTPPYGSLEIDSNADRFKLYFADKEKLLYKCTKSGTLLSRDEILAVLKEHVKDMTHKPCVVTYTNDCFERYPDGVGETNINGSCG